MKAKELAATLPVPDGEADLRLGWLEAFVAAAACADYRLAADELGIDAINVKRNVQNLELWLHRVLLDDTKQIELTDPDGIKFFDSAVDILGRINDLCDSSAKKLYVTDLRRSAISNIHVSDMRLVVYLSECTSYKQGDQHLSVSQVRRKVAAVESAFGTKIFSGRPTLRPTKFGQVIIEEFKSILWVLSSNVAICSDLSEIERQKIHWLKTRIEIQLAKLRFSIELWNSRSRLRGNARLQRDEAVEHIATLEAALDGVVEAQKLIGMPSGWIDPKKIEILES